MEEYLEHIQEIAYCNIINHIVKNAIKVNEDIVIFISQLQLWVQNVFFANTLNHLHLEPVVLLSLSFNLPGQDFFKVTY